MDFLQWEGRGFPITSFISAFPASFSPEPVCVCVCTCVHVQAQLKIKKFMLENITILKMPPISVGVMISPDTSGTRKFLSNSIVDFMLLLKPQSWNIWKCDKGDPKANVHRWVQDKNCSQRGSNDKKVSPSGEHRPGHWLLPVKYLWPLMTRVWPLWALGTEID